MIHKRKDQIEWLEFSLLQPFKELAHGVFLRKGGVSASPFATLNFGMNVGDDKEAVKRNRQLACDALNLSMLAAGTQVHGTAIAQVDGNHYNAIGDCDGLITQEEEIGLLVCHADCQAAIFFDPKHRVVANIHCGWRGCAQNIYAKTVALFQEKYGSDPTDLIVCISPSLGPKAAEFVNYKQELPEGFLPFKISDHHFDFWEIAKWQLLNAGVRLENMEIAQQCTLEEKTNFFSFRREKKTGRQGTVVGFKKTCEH